VPLQERISELYEADTPRAHRFRYGLLAFDITTVLFIVATSLAVYADDWKVAALLLLKYCAVLA
jgi:voltage-gated potassium channel